MFVFGADLPFLVIHFFRLQNGNETMGGGGGCDGGDGSVNSRKAQEINF
jgi:hypothetical protein